MCVHLSVLSQNCEKWLLALSGLSFRMEQLGSHWTDFHEILFMHIFRKFVEKIQVSLKSVKNNRYSTWRTMYNFLSNLDQFFLEWEMFETKFVEKIKPHVLCSITFFSSKMVTFMRWYGKHIAETDRPQMMRMHIACLITKATETHSEYVILIAFPQQRYLRRAVFHVTLCVRCLSFIEQYVYLSHSDQACSNVISSDLNFGDVQFEFRQGH